MMLLLGRVWNVVEFFCVRGRFGLRAFVIAVRSVRTQLPAGRGVRLGGLVGDAFVGGRVWKGDCVFFVRGRFGLRAFCFAVWSVSTQLPVGAGSAPWWFCG